MSYKKDIGLFVLKSVCFTVIFWVVWIFILRPLTSPAQSVMASSQDDQTKAQMDAYDRQANRLTEQQNVADVQQKRADKLLSIQEEQTKRFNAILEKWEKQTGVKK